MTKKMMDGREQVYKGIDPKTGDRYVDFASEEHYSYFVLRWS